jgi:hypothetical protein
MRTTWTLALQTKQRIFVDGYSMGFTRGHSDATELTKERIIQALLQDAVVRMTLDTSLLERVVEIVEES